MIATRILKIDLEIAEIIEVKVGTRHLEIDILLLHRIKKKKIGATGANFDLNYLSYFRINFQNFCGYHGERDSVFAYFEIIALSIILT